MFTIYLKDEDLLKPNHFPVVALLNEACNTDIIEFVENLTKGVGSGFNYSNCSFWNDLDEYEQKNKPKFDGLWVSNEAGEEVVVSFQELQYYLETLYQHLFAAHFANLPQLRRTLNDFEAKY